MIQLLRLAGQNARWILSVGSIAALFLPNISAALRPFLPALVSMVLAMAMARIDLGQTLRAALRPARLLQLTIIATALIPVSALCYGLIGRFFSPEIAASLVYLAAAPPIASSAGLCFLLGFNARLAVEVTVATTLLTPILGPLAVELALPDAEAYLEPLLLARNLALMIFGGVIAALLMRRLIGPARILRNAQVFDGLSAFTMLLFIFPLFDRVGGLILEDPAYAAALLALASVFNLGVNLATRAVAGRTLTPENTGTTGILMGNRTIAMYLAALPFEPTFAMFVALYQLPMYFTPLLLARLAIRP